MAGHEEDTKKKPSQTQAYIWRRRTSINRESSLVWLKIGLLSFGRPTAQIALIHREIVAQRGWLSEQKFTNALSFCMLLPGPEAMQLATYSGWRLHGVRGGLLAGVINSARRTGDAGYCNWLCLLWHDWLG